MKKQMLASLIVTLSFFINNAVAQDVEGRFGVEAKIGLIKPSVITVQGEENDQDVVPTISLGGLYGFTNNIMGEIEVSACHFGEGRHETTNINIMLGGIYRFDYVTENITPYVGGGVSYVVYASEDVDTDDTYAVNLRGGIDYAIGRNIAIPLELRLTLGGEAASYYGGKQVGHYDATSFAVMTGVKYFF